MNVAPLRVALVAALLACPLSGCGANPNALGVQDFGSISGRIVDDKTGAGIGSATISAANAVVSPDSSGGFVLQNVPVGNQNITIYSPVYRTYIGTIVVRKGQNSLAGDNGIIRLTPLNGP